MITIKENLLLGELIKHHRHLEGKTIVQLEKLTGVDKSNISRIESGLIKRPSLDNIKKIVTALNIPYEEWIKRTIQYFITRYESFDQVILKNEQCFRNSGVYPTRREIIFYYIQKTI
ncbi:helix-turn-helix domain-containing protein [Chengkuizengella axinellae]|uniref:Helix-turn-helix transcriptional regulator n=1 Tax=Chengkuizengella axinellae TaxID=3064388 RepID=A0ABT9IZL4_9BACL|nr:helix-turn-helix transcriptional regulator [Chengkuizengella sp. 2205SS18-9]MDP5274810.1 helix-turn-helix transcriptional regulator [Chengkuizengella sp. 2205SS18-9]